MPPRIYAEVNPRMLAWPREVALGMPLSVAAAKIGVSEDRLRAFEAGQAQPTVRQLRIIGRVYKRPAAFFYLENPPRPPERIEDFRALPDEHDPELPALLDAVAAAREKREIALELAEVLGHEVAQFAVAGSLQASPRILAGEIRDRLGVELETQRSWREQYKVLNEWSAAVERAGVLVTQFSGVDVQAARGFSITESPYPVVALNGKDAPRAKVFTLFHELAHIALGAGGLCDLHDEAAWGSPGIEPFCNQVAAEALVPSPSLLEEPAVIGHPDEEWDDWTIRDLATAYGVSSEVILGRLLTLNRTSLAFYQRKRSEYMARYQEAQDAGGGFLTFPRRILRDNGTAVTAMIVDAYEADLVTPTEVSRYLGGIKLTHLRKIKEALRQRAG